jgi:hypothetical protein
VIGCCVLHASICFLEVHVLAYSWSVDLFLTQPRENPATADSLAGNAGAGVSNPTTLVELTPCLGATDLSTGATRPCSDAMLLI